MLDWQWRDVIGPLFGWKRADGTRRFRRAYIEIPKKNGKSTLAAGIAIYLLVADGEAGAEIYTAAADRNQAKIVYNEVDSMIGQSALLSKRLQRRKASNRVNFPAKNSWLQALSADAPTKEGLNIHGLIFDELHAQRTRELWDTLTYGGAARDEPLLVSITTAGWDRESICWEQHEKARRVIAGEEFDSAFLGVIYGATLEDDWTKEETWRKANPSYGITLNADSFREDCNSAKSSPTQENAFKRYRLNIWTEQAVRWLPMHLWDECPDDVEASKLKNLVCYGGLDLASTQDLASLALFFPQFDAALMKYWIPEAMVSARERQNKQRLDAWVRRGFIKVTEGDVIDYGVIRADINDLVDVYKIKDIGFDPWNSSQLTTWLQEDGIKLFGFRQGFATMSPAAKHLEKLIIGRQLRHLKNPVLRWNAANAAAKTDEAGNVKPDKKKSSEKIDGLVALCIAIGRFLAQNVKKKSVYDTRGIATIGGETCSDGSKTLPNAPDS